MYVSARLHCVTFQKTVIFIVTAVRELFSPEDGGSRILENWKEHTSVCMYLPGYTA
jgi:hypothetical protein